MQNGKDIRFGPFILQKTRKRLLRGDAPVRIGQRALDLLIALAERPGEVLDHASLTGAIWPGRQVEDSNLRAQVATLRRALGESEATARHILTIPGRGYSLVAPLQPATPPRAATGMLPVRLQPVLGRDAEISLLAGKLAEHRFVSIIGAGGIGKTTVALAVARRVAADDPKPPIFVDLGTLTDGALAGGQLRAVLEAEGLGGFGLAAALGDARRLILLDCCEPVIGAAAELAAQLLRRGPHLHVLATSREPLRAEGEWSYRLPSMDVPPAEQPLSLATLPHFPACILFAERVQAAGATAIRSDADAALAGAICRRLDGIPLAIELAATRAAQLGLAALAERLDDRFRLLMQGRRTALPRHQTLGAALDWSHELLSPEEQVLLRRLAVFQGCFSLEAAIHLGGEDALGTIDRLGRLVDKSFLTLQSRGDGVAYRFLDTTRLYLAAKLEEAGEAASVAQRHARYFEAHFRAAETLWASAPVGEARESLAPDIENLRAAIDWALGPGGEPATGMALTLHGVPLWSAFGLMDEARQRLESAINAFRCEVEQEPSLGMRLYAALGTVTLFLSGTVESAWVNTLVFAERLDDTEHQLRALNGLALGAMRRDYDEALAHARRFRSIAWNSGQHDDGPVGDRLVGYILHMRGEQDEARRLTEAMLARYPRRALQPHQSKLNFYDQRILSKSVLARILWLQGETQAALDLADETVAEARQLEHPFSLFFAVGLCAGPLAWLSGDTARLAHARATILGELRQVQGWVLWGECFQALEMMAGDQVAEGVALMRDRLAAMPPTAFNRRLPVLHAGLAQGLLRLGRPAEALETIEAALADARGCRELWFEPEYLRLRGTCLLAAAGPDAAAEARAAFRAAQSIAETQQSLTWSRRAAAALARLEPARPILPATELEQIPIRWNHMIG